MVRKHDEDDVGPGRMQGAQHVDARSTVQLIVEEHAIRMRAQDGFDRLRGRSCIADDVDAFDVTDQFAESLAHRRHVVDDEDCSACCRVHGKRSSASRSGSGIGAR